MTPSCEAEKEDQRYFNSPPHKKNHIATTMINTVLFKISTHILTKRMTQQNLSKIDSWNYFNSHPHEEDDCFVFASVIMWHISTHILTKRMTLLCMLWIKYATFQLTSSRRGWRMVSWVECPKNKISTHILTKRMTKSVNSGCAFITFQLTSSRRGWLQQYQFRVHLWYFNSHPHEEDDDTVNVNSLLHQYFNSHPHEEDDLLHIFLLPGLCNISTHILTKRMTADGASSSWPFHHFNSHPHEEDDWKLVLSIHICSISTHILTKRMTAAIPVFVCLFAISTHILTKRMTAKRNR